MVAKDTFKNFYGFDNKIEFESHLFDYSSNVRPNDIERNYIRDEDSTVGYTLKYDLKNVCPKSKHEESLGRIVTNNDIYTGVYALPSDGYTDKDFDEVILDLGRKIYEARMRFNKLKINSYMFWARPQFNYRTHLVFKNLNRELSTILIHEGFKVEPIESDFDSLWADIINEFFYPKGRTKSAALRKIELNEFIHNGDDSETLAEYIERNKEHLTDLCSRLDYVNHSDYSHILINNLILQSFLRFRKAPVGKIREYLLSLKKAEYIKLLEDVKSRPQGFYALGGYSTIEQIRSLCEEIFKDSNEKILTPEEADLYLLQNLFKDSTYLSTNTFPKIKRLSERLSSYYNSNDIESEAVLYIYTKIKEKKLFEKATSKECVCFILGMIYPGLWSSKNVPGRFIVYIKNKIQSGELEVETLFKLVSKIASFKEGQLFNITKDTDWSEIDVDTTPIDWILSMNSKTDKNILGNPAYQVPLEILDF